MPLFEPGFYDVPLDGLKETLTERLVKPFTGSRRRELLLDRLLALLAEVEKVCIFTEAWIDGSFVTDKKEPNDVDLVLWYNTVSSISPRELRTYRELKDSELMMFRFRCDLYVVRNDLPRERAYWKKFFGTTRAGTPKGIIRVYF